MTVDEITSDLLPSVNVSQVASALEVMQTIDASTLPMVAQALRQLSTAVTKIQMVLKQLESPVWLPQLRLGYPEDNPPFYVDDKGYLKIQGNADIAGTISAESFKLRQLNILGLALINDSPAVGKIAWSNCQVVYDGVISNIGAGSTDKKFVYWDTGAGSFSVADAFTPQIGRFLVATNDNGTADEAWNKVAGKGIQRDNIMFALLEGLQPESYDSGDVDLSTAADTQVIVDTTGTPGAGVVLAFSVHSTAALSADGDLKLRIQIDSATYYDVPIIVGGHTYHLFTKTIRSDGTGDGSNSGDWFSVQVPISYLVSVKATLLWVRSSPGTGTVQVNMWRASKVS